MLPFDNVFVLMFSESCDKMQDIFLSRMYFLIVRYIQNCDILGKENLVQL